MSIATFSAPAATASGFTEAVARFRAEEPRFFDLSIAIAVAAIPAVFASLVDDRTFLGVDNWDKPLKFDVALFVYLMTMVFFARYIRPETRARLGYRFYAGAVVVSIVAELAWIYGAAALGTASHFNKSPLGEIIYPMMGAGAVLLTSVSAVYAALIARNGGTRLSRPIKHGIVLGLALVLPLTLMTAGTMSQLDGHFVGGVPADPEGLVFMGWARDIGDLRVSHFFATHLMHFVPLFALAYVGLFGGTARWPVWAFAACCVALVGLTFAQALNGQAFLPWLG